MANRQLRFAGRSPAGCAAGAGSAAARCGRVAGRQPQAGLHRQHERAAADLTSLRPCLLTLRAESGRPPFFQRSTGSHAPLPKRAHGPRHRPRRRRLQGKGAAGAAGAFRLAGRCACDGRQVPRHPHRELDGGRRHHRDRDRRAGSGQRAHGQDRSLRRDPQRRRRASRLSARHHQLPRRGRPGRPPRQRRPARGLRHGRRRRHQHRASAAGRHDRCLHQGQRDAAQAFRLLRLHRRRQVERGGGDPAPGAGSKAQPARVPGRPAQRVCAAPSARRRRC